MENNKFTGMSTDIEQTERDKLHSQFPHYFTNGNQDIDIQFMPCESDAKKLYAYTDPIIMIKFTKKEEYAMQFLQGNLYMKNAAWFRQIESCGGNDIQGDALESKIPFPRLNLNGLKDSDGKPVEFVDVPYAVSPDTFISCLFSFRCVNVVSVNGWQVTVAFSDEQKNEFRTLGEYAVVILDPLRFVRMYDSATKEFKYSHRGLVDYQDLSNNEVANKINQDYMDIQLGAKPTKNTSLPLHRIKRVKYSYQQEL